MDEKILARFWAKVDKDGPVHPYDPWLGNCWLWLGPTRGPGYGAFEIPALKIYSAHRASWAIAHGDFPDWCTSICHSCDVERCVSPYHLFAGTHLDNMRDMQRKGRVHRPSHVGLRNPNAKLTELDVRRIRAAYEAGESLDALSRRSGVTKENIGAIVHRKTWVHI